MIVRRFLASGLTATAIGLAMLAPVEAAAQQLGIVAVVNDEAISAFDVSQRMQIAISTSGLDNTAKNRERLAPRVLRTLIDETLQQQEAARLGLVVGEAELDEAIRTLEQRNNIPPGGFSGFLAAEGVELSAVLVQIRAELSWSKILRAEIMMNVEVSEEQINEAEARIGASKGKHRLLLSEIFLSFDRPQQSMAIREEADRILSDLRQGADFGDIARQFSQGMSAYQAGDVGWMLEDRLAPQLAAALAETEVGKLSGVIPVPGGYYIFLLRDRTVIGAVNPLDVIVHLKQVVLPLTETAQEPDVARALARAQTIASSLQGCTSMDAMVVEVGNPQSGDLGQMRLGDMPAHFRDSIATLAVGEPSVPIRLDAGVHVFMACERIDPEPDLPNRNEIAESIWNQQVEMLARRYLRDLRRVAVIDIR